MTERIGDVMESKRDSEQRVHSETSVRDSETMRAIAETVSSFLFMSDAEARPIYESPSWYEYTGTTHDDLVTRGWETFYHPDDVPALRLLWLEAGTHGRAIAYDARIKRSDGKYRWFSSRLTPVKDASGKTTKWVGAMTDIHERKLAEEERAADLEAMQRLHHVASSFLRESSGEAVLREVLEAAIAIAGANAGDIRILRPGAAHLEIIAHVGLPDWWLQFWTDEKMQSGTCGTALRNGKRVIVEDVATSPIFAGTDALAIHQRAGIRSIQSTPLLSRSGNVLGVLSTHWRAQDNPPARSLRFIDLLARHAADVLERLQVEADLRRSESRHLGVLLTSADAIVSCDQKQFVTFFNKGAEQIFGHSAAEIIGSPLSTLMPERFRASHAEHVRRFIGSAEIALPMTKRSGSIVGLRKNGEEFPIEAAISKVSVEGEILLTATVRDVTEQVRAESEQRLLADVGKSLVESLDLASTLRVIVQVVARDFYDVAVVYMREDDGSIHRHDATSSRPDRVVPDDTLIDLPTDPPPEHPLWHILDHRRCVLVHPQANAVTSTTDNDAPILTLEATGRTGFIGVPICHATTTFGALFVGSTERSRSFGARDVALLKDVAGRVALFVANARNFRAIERAVKSRDEVLGVVAHDLRNPLWNILAQATILGRSPVVPDRRVARPAEVINRAATRMNRIIDDLLDVASFEAGSVALTSRDCSVKEIMLEIIDAHRELIAAGRVEFRPPTQEQLAALPNIWADKDRMLQIFDNLLGNATKFTSQGSISIETKLHGDEVLFSVSDTGPGMSAEETEHIFDRFWRGQVTTKRGVGLGLTIVKHLVQAHGGRVWATSAMGIGSTFYFTLPVSVSSRDRLQGLTAAVSQPT